MNLLIHADPGARSGFLAAWLTNKLTSVEFDAGLILQPTYNKIHRLTDRTKISNFCGTKIRIQPQLEHIDLLMLLFLRKNVYPLIPSFTKNEYSLETFTKLNEFAKEIFLLDLELDYNMYDYVIGFSDTFNEDKLQELYIKINNHPPTNASIEVMKQINKINQISIDRNHACSISKMIMLRERELNLSEEHRFWSVVDLYNSTPIENLYDVIYNIIAPENYGILLR